MASRPWHVVRARWLPIAFRVDRRAPVVIVVLALVTAATMVVNMGQGEYRISPLDVVRTLVGIDTGDPGHVLIVGTLRLPRMLVALLVGIALATAGTLMQGLLRNPLASPDVVGVSHGASLAAVAVIVLLPEVPIAALPATAFLGAGIAALIIYAVARSGRGGPLRLILVGIGVASVAYALTTAIITFGRIFAVGQAIVWMAGSVYGRTWEHFWPLAGVLAVFLPAAWLLSRDLDALGLGDDVASGLGSRIELMRGALLLVSVGLSAAAVATAGAVGFVGLMAPHLARRLVGPSHAGLVPTAAIVGGLLVVAADLAGRTLFAPNEIPCGVITAIIGAPYFLYLLRRSPL